MDSLLEQEQNDLYQYSRGNCLIISGIPPEKDEKKNHPVNKLNKYVLKTIGIDNTELDF